MCAHSFKCRPSRRWFFVRQYMLRQGRVKGLSCKQCYSSHTDGKMDGRTKGNSSTQWCSHFSPLQVQPLVSSAKSTAVSCRCRVHLISHLLQTLQTTCPYAAGSMPSPQRLIIQQILHLVTDSIRGAFISAQTLLISVKLYGKNVYPYLLMGSTSLYDMFHIDISISSPKVL